MKFFVSFLVLTVISFAQVSQTRDIDPCYNPSSQDCKDELREVREAQKKFEREFWSEINQLITEWAQKNKNLKGEALYKAQVKDNQLKKQIVDIMVGKGLEAVAKALRADQKAIQKSFKPYPENIETKLWQTDNLLDALETIVERGDKLPTAPKYDTLSDLANARGHAQYYVKKLRDKDAQVVNNYIDRIKNIDKKVTPTN